MPLTPKTGREQPRMRQGWGTEVPQWGQRALESQVRAKLHSDAGGVGVVAALPL